MEVKKSAEKLEVVPAEIFSNYKKTILHLEKMIIERDKKTADLGKEIRWCRKELERVREIGFGFAVIKNDLISKNAKLKTEVAAIEDRASSTNIYKIIHDFLVSHTTTYYDKLAEVISSNIKSKKGIKIKNIFSYEIGDIEKLKAENDVLETKIVRLKNVLVDKKKIEKILRKAHRGIVGEAVVGKVKTIDITKVLSKYAEAIVEALSEEIK